MAFECSKCSSGEGITLGVIFIAAMVVAGAVLVVYMVSNERDGERMGFVARVKEKVSFQSLKIVIVVGQILTQVSPRKEGHKPSTCVRHPTRYLLEAAALLLLAW